MSIFSNLRRTDDASRLLLLSFLGSAGGVGERKAKGLRAIRFLKPLSMGLRKVLFQTSVAVMQ
jgi:hypothetical protein